MDKASNETMAVEKTSASEETCSTKNKPKNRGKKRKRRGSESSSDSEGILPENMLEMEKNVHASALKNNLDDISVRKILKKVVTNDHVLALVKLREEEEDSGAEEKKLCPKLTRAKVRELMKVSPKSTAWNLENLELTPIKHIPVKTRPEVKALIAQELPEDEDDDEYKPTHDDVPSDDDQTIESCSDVDSQPRTPATPRSQRATSPKVVTDGPFKVPQDVSSQVRRKLELEEEATIALRTRSKLSLSSTSIEHIESTFVPPDDLPMPAVDDLWNEFLNECLNPASMSKNEDDDDADPEYNVAADADAHDEDEEALSNSIIKISKKELNDLVTELFNIMPEVTADENLTNPLLTKNSQTEVSQWKQKQEPVSDNEATEKLSDRIVFEKSKCYNTLSVGKSEPEDIQEVEDIDSRRKEIADCLKKKKDNAGRKVKRKKESNVLNMCIEETDNPEAPPVLQHLRTAQRTERVQIQIDSSVCITREQVLILQQQLRQHIQVATSNFLQLYVHPIHWSLAPTYKEYLETLSKMTESNPNSVVNVCNLKPAVELVRTWEKTLADDTPENAEIVQFIQSEAERSRRRYANNSLYIGEFHETVQKVVANSPVFLYPYLLPSMPYRADNMKRFSYLPSEDELITLGMEQFWQYVESNPALFKPRRRPAARRRWGLAVTLQLVVKHMLPWLSTKTLLGHLAYVRSTADKNNPIYKFLKSGEVTPVKHKLLPFNPNITLYEQPEHEMPRIWLRYLAKTSKRFRNYLFRRHDVTGREPTGVPIDVGISINTAVKKPLPIDFTKEIICSRANMHPRISKPVLTDKFDVHIDKGPITETTAVAPPVMTPVVASNFFRVVETSSGAFLVPLQVIQTSTVNTNTAPIITPAEVKTTILANNPPEKNDIQCQSKITENKRKFHSNQKHCQCCILLRKICKEKQTFITDYFKSNRRKSNEECHCNSRKYPKVSNRLKILIDMFKSTPQRVLNELEKKLKLVKKEMEDSDGEELSEMDAILNSCNSDDLAYVTSYQLKLIVRTSIARNTYVKKRVNNLFSRFDLDTDDPTVLANELYKAFDVEMVDLYMEFLGFLTPEQADKMEVFGDYFTRCCVQDLIKKIDKLIPNKVAQRKILSHLNGVFVDSVSTSCEMCSGLLGTMDGHPNLARYVFSLFPHRSEPKFVSLVHAKTDSISKLANQTAPQDDKRRSTMDYEADHSSSGEDTVTGFVIDNSCTNEQSGAIETVKIEEPDSENSMDATKFVVSNTEVADSCDSDTNMAITMSGDEYVKSETPEWKRDEDKLILEILQQYLTPEERKDKTILELLEEKNVFKVISESLLHKSMDDVKERVLYLLHILVISET